MYDYKNYSRKPGIRNIVLIGIWGGCIVSYASFFNSGHLYYVMDQDNNKKKFGYYNLAPAFWFL